MTVPPGCAPEPSREHREPQTVRLIGNHSDYLRPSGYLVRVACQVQGPGAVHDLTAARTWGT